MDVGVVVLVVLGHGRENLSGLLRGVGRVEVVDWLAVDLALEQGEVGPDGGDVEAHRQAS